MKSIVKLTLRLITIVISIVKAILLVKVIAVVTIRASWILLHELKIEVYIIPRMILMLWGLL